MRGRDTKQACRNLSLSLSLSLLLVRGWPNSLATSDAASSSLALDEIQVSDRHNLTWSVIPGGCTKSRHTCSTP